MSSFETVTVTSIKAYHTLRSNWKMGEGAPPGFAHVTVSVLAGRPMDLRKRIADGMYEELRSHFTMSLEDDEVQLTLELREMEVDTYRKG